MAEVRQVLRNLRSRIVQFAKSVKRDQMLALYDQVEGDFYFLPNSTTNVTVRDKTDPAAIELSFWGGI